MNERKLKKIKCPCCGQTMVEIFDICEVCDWVHDEQQLENPDLAGGANHMSLNQAKEAWKTGIPIE